MKELIKIKKGSSFLENNLVKALQHGELGCMVNGIR